MTITIDGPAGSGKSTVARVLATRLGFEFLDTGAMYRAVALRCLQSGIHPADEISVAAAARAAVIEFPDGRPHLDGVDVSRELRSETVSEAASRVALNSGVRAALVATQRRIAAGRNVVTEGRDQGTVVFPDAALKIFLTASAETRAARRHAELRGRVHDVDYGRVLTQILDRDERDRNRDIAPLAAAADAITLDTSRKSVEQAVAFIEQLARERIDSAAAETSPPDPTSDP